MKHETVRVSRKGRDWPIIIGLMAAGIAVAIVAVRYLLTFKPWELML